MENIIEIKGLKKFYDEGKVKALNGIDLNIKKGEFVSIIGPSGSGKSTLLNMIGSLEIPDEGVIKVADYDLLNTPNLDEFRGRKIGFIFQLHNLIPNLNIVQNIEIPMYPLGLSSKEMRERALELLKLVNIEDKAKSLPNQLSGGERQRVAIARSLANKPEIILADEPTGSLDSKNGNNILNLLIKLHKEEGVTLIVVTHDMNVANLADRVIEVFDGKIANAGEDSLLHKKIGVN